MACPAAGVYIWCAFASLTGKLIFIANVCGYEEFMIEYDSSWWGVYIYILKFSSMCNSVPHWPISCADINQWPYGPMDHAGIPEPFAHSKKLLRSHVHLPLILALTSWHHVRQLAFWCDVQLHRPGWEIRSPTWPLGRWSPAAWDILSSDLWWWDWAQWALRAWVFSTLALHGMWLGEC